MLRLRLLPVLGVEGSRSAQTRPGEVVARGVQPTAVVPVIKDRPLPRFLDDPLSSETAHREGALGQRVQGCAGVRGGGRGRCRRRLQPTHEFRETIKASDQRDRACTKARKSSSLCSCLRLNSEASRRKIG